jgi:hypothetical protein
VVKTPTITETIRLNRLRWFGHEQRVEENRITEKILYMNFMFHRAFQFTIYNGPTDALVCNKTLIQMSHIKYLKSLQHVSIIR